MCSCSIVGTRIQVCVCACGRQALQIDRMVIEELVLTNPGSTIMAVMDRLLNFSARRSAGFASSSDEA